jgi:hypothetical protein
MTRTRLSTILGVAAVALSLCIHGCLSVPQIAARGSVAGHALSGPVDSEVARDYLEGRALPSEQDFRGEKTHWWDLLRKHTNGSGSWRPRQHDLQYTGSRVGCLTISLSLPVSGAAAGLVAARFPRWHWVDTSSSVTGERPAAAKISIASSEETALETIFRMA